MKEVLLIALFLFTLCQKTAQKPLVSHIIENNRKTGTDLNVSQNSSMQHSAVLVNILKDDEIEQPRSSIDLKGNNKVGEVDSNGEDKKVDMTFCETRIVWETKPVCHQNVCVNVKQSRLVYDCIAVMTPVP
uniref:Uncharacterized protein n=1 Tax=Clytia hemisphaerica TaxID=252671 RepID=A0A7M5WZP3_9CNID